MRELFVLARQFLVELDVAHDQGHLVAQRAKRGDRRLGEDLVGTVQQAHHAEQFVFGLERRREESVVAILLHGLEQASDLGVRDLLVAFRAGAGDVDDAELLVAPGGIGAEAADERPLFEVAGVVD